MIVENVRHVCCDFCDNACVALEPPPTWRHYQLRRVDWGGNYVPGRYDNFVLCEACAADAEPERLSLFRRIFGRRRP